jgi:chromosome segregation ATPase
MLELCDAAQFVKRRQTVAKRDGALLNRFLDTAYAFCEAYVEAAKDAESQTVETWMSDTESLLDALAEAAQVENAEAVEEEAAATVCRRLINCDENASPEYLLETAQKAVARGDVSGAKSLALQAAAHIARAEAEKAEERVLEAETRLREGADAIDRARSGVKKSEQEVVVAESRVTESEGELTDARESVTQATERVGGIDHRVGEIDEQIRALMAARQGEEAKRTEANVELERNRELEIQSEADLRSLQEAEDAARLRLENIRQQVKNLQRRRTELEAALARGRETLTRDRASLSDIERTVSQLHSAESPDAAAAGEQQEELLF